MTTTTWNADTDNKVKAQYQLMKRHWVVSSSFPTKGFLRDPQKHVLEKKSFQVCPVSSMTTVSHPRTIIWLGMDPGRTQEKPQKQTTGNAVISALSLEHFSPVCQSFGEGFPNIQAGCQGSLNKRRRQKAMCIISCFFPACCPFTQQCLVPSLSYSPTRKTSILGHCGEGAIHLTARGRGGLGLSLFPELIFNSTYCFQPQLHPCFQKYLVPPIAEHLEDSEM